jgi:hypothetical protein
MITHREHYLKSIGKDPNVSYSMEQLSQFSGVPLSILKKIDLRGRGAAVSNLASVRLKKDFSKNPDTTKYPASARLSPERWGMARIYSFLDKGQTYKTADADLAREARY